jgi:hypothetical protein
MIVAGLQDFSCNSDVTYFPFDNHACEIRLLTMEFYSDIILLATPTGVSMEYILPNAEWKISYDLVEASSLEQNTQLIFHLTLRRGIHVLRMGIFIEVRLPCSTGSHILISSDQFMTYETTRRNVPETSSQF